MRKGLISALVSMVLLVSMVSLTACNKSKQPTTSSTTVQNTMQTLDYSKKLGDAIVAYSLGRPYDNAYGAPLASLTPLNSGAKTIQLDNESAAHVAYVLKTVIQYSETLKGSPYYDAADSSKIKYDAEIMSQIGKTLFPDGTAPDIKPTDSDMRITPEFLAWFIERSKATGLLDKRLTFTMGDTTTLTVNSDDCSESKGGSTFTVFDTKATVKVDASDIATSALYTMTLKSYRYYDTGLYEAIYETDPKAGASSSVQMTVSFLYNSTKDTGNAKSDLDKYLARITNITVNITK